MRSLFSWSGQSKQFLQLWWGTHFEQFDFNTQTYALTGEVPIPFFDGKDDEMFLETALKNNFQIVGIDQEYQCAQFFLFDEILTLSKNKKSMLPAYKNAYNFMFVHPK